VASSTWATPQANRVTGTDGTQFPRGVQDGQTFNVYVNQLRRVVTLGNVNNAHETFEGIDLCHFTIPTPFLLNATGNPLSADFYSFYYNGVANLTATGEPDFYVTKPHFLDVDPQALAATTGISAPSVDLHDTYLSVEPITGVTMRAAKRLQLNVRVVPIFTAYINTTNGQVMPQLYGPQLPNGGVLIPVYWADEGADISSSDANSFKSAVYGAQKASMGLYIAGEALGCAFAVATVILFWVSSMKSGAVTDSKGAIPL